MSILYQLSEKSDLLLGFGISMISALSLLALQWRRENRISKDKTTLIKKSIYNTLLQNKGLLEGIFDNKLHPSSLQLSGLYQLTTVRYTFIDEIEFHTDFEILLFNIGNVEILLKARETVSLSNITNALVTIDNTRIQNMAKEQLKEIERFVKKHYDDTNYEHYINFKIKIKEF